MKILFLDDDKNRHATFRMNNIGLDITYVWTADEAIEAFKKEVFDEVSLDHDLAWQKNMQLPDAGEGSGYDVAIFISKLPKEKRPKMVIIHSLNPAGAHRMGQALKECRQEGMRVMRIPFGS